MTKTIRFVSRYMGTIRYKKRCMLIKNDSIRFDAMRFNAVQLLKTLSCEETMDLILEHFLKCLIKYLLTNLRRPTSEKISAGFMNAWKCVLNCNSHAPELAYRNAPPAPYKCMLLQHVHTPQATRKQLQRLIKIISKQAPVHPDLISPGKRWRYCCRM